MDTTRLRPSDEKILRMALASASVRRMRGLTVQVLAFVLFAFAAFTMLGTAPPLATGTAVIAVFAAGWAGYWSGLDRGMDVMDRGGVAREWAAEEAPPEEMVPPQGS